jgi:hypothetical protein
MSINGMNGNGPRIIGDPAQALVAVGTENSQLHEELAKVYVELDRYRNALTTIGKMPFAAAADLAKRALAGK